MLISLADPNIVSDPLSVRIVHAAQSPSGTRFAMANGAGEIYMCECKANTVLTPYQLKKAASKISIAAFKPGNLTLSFPQENEILVFWAKDGKLSLRAIRYIEGAEVISDFDLRPDFDRLFVEWVQLGIFQYSEDRTRRLEISQQWRRMQWDLFEDPTWRNCQGYKSM